jgi:vacuolar-type H+-ATPase subunit H
VPVDRGRQIDAELEPVFSALDHAQHEAVGIVEAAARDAAHRRADALEQGRRLVAEARAQAHAARAEAAASRIAETDAECSRLLAAARDEATRIGRVAAERAPALREEVVRRVLSLGESAP